MPDFAAQMETALRFLVAIVGRANPAPNDVDELRTLAPECADYPLDGLACEVIQHAVTKRALNHAA